MQSSGLVDEGKTWRLLIDKPARAAYNMAVDEAILLSHSKGDVPPTLRLYQWAPPAVSAGYSQDMLTKVDVKFCRQHGIDVVRRLTGGRAVLHDREITYSVVIGLNLLPGSVLQTYKFLSEGLAAAIEKLGLEPEIESRPQKSANLGSPACFDSPSWYEIEVCGRKIVGSAQVRKQQVLLQHGSVLLELDKNKLLQVMLYRSEKMRRQIAASHEQKATAINPELLRLGKQPIKTSQVELALVEGFCHGLGIKLEPSVLTPKEKALAANLEKNKYSSPSWIYLRKECETQCLT